MNHEASPAGIQAPRFIPRYHDGPFRLAIILLVSLCISLYGGGSLLDALSDPAYYPELAATLLYTALLTEWISAATRRLDSLFDWEHRGITRLLLQAVFGILLPAVMELILATLWFRMTGTDIRETTFIEYAFPLILQLMLLFNTYYFAHYAFLQWKRAKATGNGTGSAESNEITAFFGGKMISLANDEILYACRQGKYNYVKTSREGGTTYTVSLPLDELEKKLGNTSFFRLNRQLIAHRACCTGYQPIDYGKLLVSLSPASPSGKTAVVSQKKAPAFRAWIAAQKK